MNSTCYRIFFISVFILLFFLFLLQNGKVVYRGLTEGLVCANTYVSAKEYMFERQ